MYVSYRWLQEYFDAPLPTPEELATLFTAHLFEVEEVKAHGDDFVFDCKVLPDRAHYLLSHEGVATEVCVLTGLVRKEVVQIPAPEATGGVAVSIANTELCRRYLAQEITDVTVTESPAWLRERLEAVGQKSINSIVDATNFVMLDVGQPLHAFDADKVVGEIVVRNAHEGETIVLLSGQEVTLVPEDLVIADAEGAIAIAGVKGGKRAEMTMETTRVIVESANFEPTTVRKTSTRLNLRNESSKRFENEITPELATKGMAKMLELVATLAPGAQLGARTDVYPEPVAPWEVVVDATHVSAVIGTTITADAITTTLTRMGCTVTEDGEMIHIVPPFVRLDLVIPEDIAEEVGRVMGYEKLPAVLPPTLSSTLRPDTVFFYGERIKNELVSRGYSETLLYSLVQKGVYEIAYPLASDKAALRESLVPKLKDALIINGRNADLLSLETIKLCEVGKVFQADGEKAMLALGVLPVKKKKGVTAESILTEDIAALAATLGVGIPHTIEVGPFGAVVEIDLDALVATLPPATSIADLSFAQLPRDKQYTKFSLYPFIVRDVAVFVPESVTEADVLTLIMQHVGPLCVKSWLFDVFKKETPEGVKQSYAFRFVFQSFERTLEDTEVNAIMDTVYAAIAAEPSWEIR